MNALHVIGAPGPVQYAEGIIAIRGEDSDAVRRSAYLDLAIAAWALVSEKEWAEIVAFAEKLEITREINFDKSSRPVVSLGTEPSHAPDVEEVQG